MNSFIQEKEGNREDEFPQRGSAKSRHYIITATPRDVIEAAHPNQL